MTSVEHDLFRHRGEAAELMRSTRWENTALGAVDTWPRTLKVLVPAMLASRFAMRIVWGPEFILLYNDAYRPILGAQKHPSAMGSRIPDSYAEIWDIVGPLFRKVYEGESFAQDNLMLPLERYGYREECYFTLSYSPLEDDDGKIGGLLGVVHETTEQVLVARRLATLRAVAASTATAKSMKDACSGAAHALGTNAQDAPFVLVYAADGDGNTCTLQARSGVDSSSPVAPKSIARRSMASDTWPLMDTFAGDGPRVVADVSERFGELHAGPFPEPVRCAVIVPLVRAQQERPIGFLVAGVNPRRALDDAYLTFFALAADHVTTALSNASVEEVERRSRAREKASYDRLRTLFNEAPAAIAVTRGKTHVFELANPLYRELVGRDDMLGKPGRAALPELEMQGIWDIFDRVYEVGVPYFGKEYPAKVNRNGRLVDCYFNFTAQPMIDESGHVEGVMVFAIEITEQVEGRAERATLLERERRAREEAERSNDAKDEFLAIVSHELRNPLSAMLGWTRLLRSGLPEDKRDQALQTIERNALAQTQLIEDLLDVARITSGKMRLDVTLVSFRDIVEAALDSAKPAMEAKQLRLRTVLDSTETALMGDVTRLQQVVWNLVTNATKFTPKGGSILVVLKRSHSTLELSVTDSGIGIDASFIPQIFERFRQADASTTRTHAGLGLGLAIAKRIVEMHGGVIGVRSEGKDKGSTFTVTLPVAAVHAQPRQETDARAEAPAARGQSAELAGLKVLVLDDEQDAREVVAAMLELDGATTVLAGSVREAIEVFERERPDVVLSDIGMPGEDGYGFIRRIRSRARESGGATPSASLTAYTSAEDRRRALAAGFDAHVAKPVEPRELMAVVSNLARMARALR